MTGDYSMGHTPDRERGRKYRRRLLQQGRPMLDADSVADGKTKAPRRWWLVQEVPLAPAWTDFNGSDPGVTLVELFTFLADTLLWQIDEQQRRRRRRRRVALVVVGTAGTCLFLGRWRSPSR